ncbi:DUF4097 family beta strand repeat-containing protein [Xanthomonas oryzae]|uniref:DUF4097 family beta strand repeat-containing protein n=1 Tax=Xanthomonas oryzae TaxID=347 RepID=UPI00031EBF38|nr:DUF4097 family beta strand repeat-containing protein [Xanthomonas oryzae]
MRSAHRSLLVLAASCAVPAAAQTAVKQSHPLARGGRVELENIAGSIRVRGWDRDEVALTGSLGQGQRLQVDESANRLQLEVIYPRNSRNSKGAELELRVPRGAVLQVDAVSAAVDVDQVDLARLQLKSVSGDVIAAGRAKEAQLETVSGALRSTLSSGRTTLGTVSGQLNAPTGASGAVAVESVSGDIRIAAGQVSRLRAQSVSGTTAVTVAGGWRRAAAWRRRASVARLRWGCRAICRQRWMRTSSVAISTRSPARWNGRRTAPANTSRQRWGPAMATSDWSRIRARCVSITPAKSG